MEEQGGIARRVEIPAAEHARGHLVGIEVHAGEHRGEGGKREPCGADSQAPSLGDAPQENQAEPSVERCSGRDQAFQAEEGHAVRGEKHPEN